MLRRITNFGNGALAAGRIFGTIRGACLFTGRANMRTAQNNPQDRQERIRRLRARAAQARTIAAEVADQMTRANLLNVAFSYENVADFLSRLPSESDTAYPRRTRSTINRLR